MKRGRKFNYTNLILLLTYMVNNKMLGEEAIKSLTNVYQ